MTLMASKIALTEEEYLHKSFPDLDREFRDGEVIERSMPDWFHAKSQGGFHGFFWARRKEFNIDVVPELRVKLRPGRHVIPDVAVFWPSEPSGSVPDRLPLIVIEVISPDDRLTDVRDKLQEYADAGVTHIWLVDPLRKVFYLFKDGLHEVKSYTVGELSLTVQPADIFE
jgi:Uma2 family endonuclease